jgi:hypothetical protein
MCVCFICNHMFNEGDRTPRQKKKIKNMRSTNRKPKIRPSDSPMICPRLSPWERNASAVCDRGVPPPMPVTEKDISVAGGLPARSVTPAREGHFLDQGLRPFGGQSDLKKWGILSWWPRSHPCRSPSLRRAEMLFSSRFRAFPGPWTVVHATDVVSDAQNQVEAKLPLPGRSPPWQLA